LTCSFVPALVDDDDSDPADDNDPSVQDDTILNGFDQHVPPAPQAPPAILAPPPPLDILDFLHRTSSYDLQSVFQLAEKLPSVPAHVSSERAGGGTEATAEAEGSQGSAFSKCSVCILNKSNYIRRRHNNCVGNIWKRKITIF